MTFQKKEPTLKVELPSAPEADFGDNTPNRNLNGYAGRAYKIKIFGAEGEAQWLDQFFCGTLGPFSLRRNTELIVPEEVVEALNSANEATVIRHHFTGGGDKEEVEEPLMRFPFTNYGEVPWDDYLKFKAEQNTKPLPSSRKVS